MNQIPQIITVLLVSLLLFIPIASAWEKNVGQWEDFDDTWEENTNDIRHEETTEFYSEPESVRIKNMARGWVEIKDEGDLTITFKLQMRKANDQLQVSIHHDSGPNHRDLDVVFIFRQIDSDAADISIWDTRYEGGKFETDTFKGSDFFSGQWVDVRIDVEYVSGLPLASLYATNENNNKMEIENFELHTDTIELMKQYYDWVKFMPMFDTVVYIDDISISTPGDDNPYNPVVDLGGNTVGGLGGAAILGGFIIIIAYSAYYFNLIPLPAYRKGRVSFSKRRRS